MGDRWLVRGTEFPPGGKPVFLSEDSISPAQGTLRADEQGVFQVPYQSFPGELEEQVSRLSLRRFLTQLTGAKPARRFLAEMFKPMSDSE